MYNKQGEQNGKGERNEKSIYGFKDLRIARNLIYGTKTNGI